jgi:ABC-type sugar transport system permease subunit
LSNTNHTENKQWSTQHYTEVVCVAQWLVFCVVFCRSLFVFSVVCVAQFLVFCRSWFVFSVTNNDLQNTTQNTNHWATQTTLKTNNDLLNSTQNTKYWAFVSSVVCVAQCLVFCVVLCRSLFVFSGVCVSQCLVLCVVLENKQLSTEH